MSKTNLGQASETLKEILSKPENKYNPEKETLPHYVDRMTPHFIYHVMNRFPAQVRKVIAEMAEINEPARVKTISEKCRVFQHSQVSAILHRLKEYGVAESTEKGWQLCSWELVQVLRLRRAATRISQA